MISVPDNVIVKLIIIATYLVGTFCYNSMHVNHYLGIRNEYQFFKIAIVCALKTHTHRVEAAGHGILFTPDFKQESGANLTLIILAIITCTVVLIHRCDDILKKIDV